MWLIEFFCFIFGLCMAVLIPFFAFMAIAYILAIPYLIWASFAIRKPDTPKNFKYEAGIFKTIGRSLRFYFQLLCFKKPTLM